MEKINLHTHTTYCDGKNTAEEMVLSAIGKGFTTLGFSSHTMYPFAGDCHIAYKEHQKYADEIKALSEKYRDKIQILLGFEVEYFPPMSIPRKSTYEEFKPDYIIGAVHYNIHKDQQGSVDGSVSEVRALVEDIYNKDARACVCDYFEAQRQMLKKGNFDIWAHPDLIRKRNGKLKLFDENEDWYKKELAETVKVAAKANIIAEINTGAIARGAMDDVYPSAYFLRLIYEAGIPICVNSDCHNAPDIDCAFDRAYQAARNAGYKELTYPVKGKLVTIKL